jgi:hypothetical protein
MALSARGVEHANPPGARWPMPTSSEEPLRPPLAASSPMKGSLWALLRLIFRVYYGKAASESEQTVPEK